MKKSISRIFDNKIRRFAFIAVCSVGVSLLLALGLMLITGADKFWNGFKIIYILFGAAPTIGGIIQLVFPNYEEISYQLGCGFFYGGLVCMKLLHWVGIPETEAVTGVAFVISGLVCIIVALKRKGT